jgi:acyl carrier protein
MIDAEIEEALRDFLVDALFFGEAMPLAANEDLFALGLDSMAITRLVVFAERRFGARIPDREVVPENLRTLSSLVGLVRRCSA